MTDTESTSTLINHVQVHVVRCSVFSQAWQCPRWCLQKEARDAEERHSSVAADLRAQLAAAQASAEAAQEEAAAAAEALERHQAKQAHNAEQLRAAVVESQQVRGHITSQPQFCSMLVRHPNTDATQTLKHCRQGVLRHAMAGCTQPQC